MLRKAHSAGNAWRQRNSEIAKQNKKKNKQKKHLHFRSTFIMITKF